IPCWASKGRTYRDVESGVRPESAFRRREPPESAWCDRSGLFAGAGLVRPESSFCRRGLGATGVGFPPERAWCDRSRLSAGAGLVRPESAFCRSGLPHISEVCCELGFVAPPLAACEGALDGRPDSCRHAARAAADGGYSTGTVAPGAGRREACGAEDATPSVISTSSSWWECSATRTMETSK